MTNIFTKQISPIPMAIIVVVIFGIIFLIQYFSPQGQCEREAKRNVYKAAAVANINEVNPMYKTILDGMVKDETRKCLEERGK